MKTKATVVLFLLFTINLFSQDSKLSVEANFPIPSGDNFFGENYGGVIDIGAKYRFIELSIIDIGGSINGGLFKNSKVDNRLFDINVYSIQPRLFAEFKFTEMSKLHPQLGIGYSFFRFKSDANESHSNFADRTENGINLNLAIAYDITDKFFVQIQYDFIKLGTDDFTPDIKYNTNLNILKFGLGIKL